MLVDPRRDVAAGPAQPAAARLHHTGDHPHDGAALDEQRPQHQRRHQDTDRDPDQVETGSLGPGDGHPGGGHHGQGDGGGHEHGAERPSGQGGVGPASAVLAEGVDERDERTGGNGIGDGGGGQRDGGEAAHGHVHTAGQEQTTLDDGEGHERAELQPRGHQEPLPTEVGEVVRRPRQLAAPAGHHPQHQRGQGDPAGEFDPRPGAPVRAAAPGTLRHVEAGSTRIFTCSSGRASDAKASATPSSPTVPVTMGATSTSPSAMARSAPANSSVE